MVRFRRMVRHFAMVCLAAPALALAAPAGTHLRVDKIFSSIDGHLQAVQLRIVRVDNQPLSLVGKSMVVRDRRGAVRTIPLVANPHAITAYDNRSRLLVSTRENDYWGPYSDLVMPVATLPIDGGTITIEGWDEVVYGRLPEDGRHAVTSDGDVVPAEFEKWDGFDVVGTTVSEFHHEASDHYFMTNRLDEIILLTEGVIPGWQPTGKAFQFFLRPLGAGMFPVCRYLLLRPGSASHFFSGSAAECAAAGASEGNLLELASAFVAAMPADGACGMLRLAFPNGSTAYDVLTAPIYRLWNGKPDTNHRFVADKSERDAMIARGWISEGEGIDGIGLCGWASDWIYP